MNKKDLFKSLNSLCCEMNKSYNINSGGCCFVAAVIAEQLEKYNIPFKVAVAFSPTHYWIKVSGGYINRNKYKVGCVENWNSSYLYDIYYIKEWNNYYNRKYNLIVKTKIKSLFKKYENNRT